MTDEIAGYIAEFFIADNLENPDISWTEDSIVSDIVEMYGPDGSVSAYSAEIATNGVDNGYIIISAYEGAESLITEYSDQSAPLYEELDVAQDEQIVYCGSLNYFKDDGSEELLTINDETISKEEVEDLFSEDNLTQSTPTISTFAQLGYGEAIIEPIAYAIKVYGGNYKCHEYRNTLESYCKFRYSDFYTTYSYGYWRGNCGPTAVTNIVEIVGNARNISKIKSTSHEIIFDKIAGHGEKNGYYKTGSGTSHTGNLIKGGFSEFNVNVTVTSKTPTYENIKREIDLNQPFCIELLNYAHYCKYDDYGNLLAGHDVTGYAYTRFLNTDTGYYKSFVKIADGNATSGRYLDIATLQSRNVGFLWTIQLS